MTRNRLLLVFLCLGFFTLLLFSCGDEDNSPPTQAPPAPLDTDGDGIRDIYDNCPQIWNQSQSDVDGDGFGDSCDVDIDEDGVLNVNDNCPYVVNPDQADSDQDGIGEVCDDNDNDRVLNPDDNCPDTFNPAQDDLDGDGIGDSCDVDLDNDGVLNDVDNCLTVYNPGQFDLDFDGLGSACDRFEPSVVRFDSTAVLEPKVCAEGGLILYPTTITLVNIGNADAELRSVTIQLFDKEQSIGFRTFETGIDQVSLCGEEQSSFVPADLEGCGGTATFTVHFISPYVTLVRVTNIDYRKGDDRECL